MHHEIQSNPNLYDLVYAYRLQGKKWVQRAKKQSNDKRELERFPRYLLFFLAAVSQSFQKNITFILLV